MNLQPEALVAACCACLMLIIFTSSLAPLRLLLPPVPFRVKNVWYNPPFFGNPTARSARYKYFKKYDLRKKS